MSRRLTGRGPMGSTRWLLQAARWGQRNTQRRVRRIASGVSETCNATRAKLGPVRGTGRSEGSRDDCHPNHFSRPLRSRRQGAEVGAPLTERNRIPEFQWPELTRRGHALTLDSRRTESAEVGPNGQFAFGPAHPSPIWPGRAGGQMGAKRATRRVQNRRPDDRS